MSKKDAPDDARKKILARRATFVAAALAGVSAACGKEPSQPHPCLSPMPQPTDTSPQPCLSPMPQPTDSAPPVYTPPPEDAGAPQPCLKVAMPVDDDAGAPHKPKPPPRPCLKVMPPKDPR